MTYLGIAQKSLLWKSLILSFKHHHSLPIICLVQRKAHAPILPPAYGQICNPPLIVNIEYASYALFKVVYFLLNISNIYIFIQIWKPACIQCNLCTLLSLCQT